MDGDGGVGDGGVAVGVALGLALGAALGEALGEALGDAAGEALGLALGEAVDEETERLGPLPLAADASICVQGKPWAVQSI